MAMGWLGGGKDLSLAELITRKQYKKAIDLLQAEFQKGERSPRLRLQFADVLVMADRGREALPILLGLAHEFGRDGFAAKAIAVLKKAEKIQPGDPAIERRLAGLIHEKQREVSITATGSFVLPPSASEPHDVSRGGAAREAGRLPPDPEARHHPDDGARREGREDQHRRPPRRRGDRPHREAGEGVDPALLGKNDLPGLAPGAQYTNWDAPVLSIALTQAQPERQGLFGFLFIGFAAAALLSALAFLLYVLFSFQQRFIELGVLRAAGLSMTQMSGFMAWELTFLILLGVSIGTVFGVWVSRWFIPFLQIVVPNGIIAAGVERMAA